MRILWQRSHHPQSCRADETNCCKSCSQRNVAYRKIFEGHSATPPASKLDLSIIQCTHSQSTRGCRSGSVGHGSREHTDFQAMTISQFSHTYCYNTTLLTTYRVAKHLEYIGLQRLDLPIVLKRFWGKSPMRSARVWTLENNTSSSWLHGPRWPHPTCRPLVPKRRKHLRHN